VGLDIGTSAVRAAEVSFTKGGAKLERFGQVALAPGAVVNGEVVDAVAVAGAIKKLWGQSKFTTKRVVLGVANNKVVVRQIDLPWMERDELKQALAFQVQDFIPMPVEQAILDYHPVSEFTNDAGGRMLRVLLVAAARETVNASLGAVEKAGLRPSMVDLTSFAVIRALAEPSEIGLSREPEAVVDIGERVTNIAVHEGGVPRFVRILLMGGGDITDAVADRMGLGPEQAESVKHELGLASPVTEPGGLVGQADGHPARRVLDSSATAFIEEIRGSLDYYMAASSSRPIRRVLLSGGGARLSGLVERLSQATRLPVEVAEPLAAMRVGRTGLSDEQIAYVGPLATVPVGLALGAAA
jgi:type IV pilus assembly protein PilM